MSNPKLLSALCYFSIFFLPLLLPFIIYLATEEHEVKFHAKRSLISHSIPVILLIVGLIIFSFSMFSIDNQAIAILSGNFNFWHFTPLIFTGLYSILFFAIFIWNVFQGIKLFK